MLTGKRGDRLIIDDPWCDGTPPPDHAEAVRRFVEAIRARTEGVTPVIVMARLWKGDDQ